MFAKRDFSLVLIVGPFIVGFSARFLFESEASVRLFFCQNDPFYLSSYQKMKICDSLCLSHFAYLSD